MKSSILTIIFLTFTTLCLADWPEFRGPNADGTVEGALPTIWSETENVKWKQPVHGLGWSTPIIRDNRIWITTATEDGTSMSLLCFDFESGHVLLDRVLVTNDNPEPLGNKMNTYASCSVVADEDTVYASFGSYGTFAIDAKSFETKWQRRDIRCSHWRGPASSPVLWENLLILTFDGTDQQFLTGLDQTTGKTVWRTDRATVFDDEDEKGIPANSGDRRKAYSTPYILEVDGKAIMVSNAARACWAYDPSTGEPLWHVYYPTHSPSSRTVFSPEENLLYINTGLGKAEVWAIRVDPEARGDITDTHVEWQALKRTPKRSSPVLTNQLLFFANDAVASCVEPRTGEVVWTERIGGDYSASLLAANGLVYFFDENGLCTVIRASRDFEVISENQLESGFMASPAAYEVSLVLRTRTHLYRIDQ